MIFLKYIDSLGSFHALRLTKDLDKAKGDFTVSYKKFASWVTEMKMELKDGTQKCDQLTQSLGEFLGKTCLVTALNV